MAITDINISEQLQTDAPSIRYSGTEGPQSPQEHQQAQRIAQQIWEALSPEQQGQFQSFEQFFQSGVWKQILQQMQQDEARGLQQAEGIGSLGPRNMEQQMPMPNRMGAEYGGRMGFRYGKTSSSRANDETAIESAVDWVMKASEENGEPISYREALEKVLSEFRKPRDPREEITQEEIIEQLRPRDPGFRRPTPDWDRDPGFRRPTPDWDRDPGFRRPTPDWDPGEDPGFIRPRRPYEEEEIVGIESLRGRR